MVSEPLKREFHTELARLHYWSMRALRDKIHSMIFDRDFSKIAAELVSTAIRRTSHGRVFQYMARTQKVAHRSQDH
jgi:predicted nuclease of restriction endonuclease-like (RecB) superfamily